MGRGLRERSGGLEIASLVLAIVAVVVAGAGALFSRQQVQQARSATRVQSILTVVDYLQRQDIRDSRRVVLSQLEGVSVDGWNDRQRESAAAVASS